MPVGSCSCGAVYACDATGHNLGSAFIEALVFGCNMDWDLAWGLLPGEDYLEKLVEKYDLQTHLIIPGGFFEGRKISGTLYFIRMHREIREATCQGVQKKLDRATPPSPGPPLKPAGEKRYAKKRVEELVREYRVDELVSIAGEDKRIIRELQRLLYSGDELVRLRAAEITGRVSAVIARQDPGTIANFLQGLFASLDTGASGWGALDAIGEIISCSPELFAGYIPSMYQFLAIESYRPKVLRAVGKIAESRPDLIQKTAFRFMSFLQHPQPETRGYAAWLFGHLDAPAAVKGLELILEDGREINLYINGNIEKTTVGRLASEAVKKIKAGIVAGC